MKPPAILDGAQVLEWAWSGDQPFGVVPGGDAPDIIYGLAIARYEKSGSVYRFACNSTWEVIQDSNYVSTQEAKARLPLQYNGVAAIWHIYTDQNEEKKNGA